MPTEYDSYQDSRYDQRQGSSFSGLKLRLMIGGVIVLFSLINYVFKGQDNPITGERQRVSMSVAEEVSFGRQSVPSMGYESRNFQASQRVKSVGQELVIALEDYLHQNQADGTNSRRVKNPYPFEFHLLDNSGQNRGSVNAFALPGGQVFITEELYRRLADTARSEDDFKGRLAGVLGHEIGHVIERHSAQRMAQSGLWQGVASAAGVAGGDMSSAQVASAVGNIVSMKYGRDDELESDRWGVRLMVQAQYHPEHLLAVMDVLKEAGGDDRSPEFMSTHPRPENRKKYIDEIVIKDYPNGLPTNLR